MVLEELKLLKQHLEFGKSPTMLKEKLISITNEFDVNMASFSAQEVDIIVNLIGYIYSKFQLFNTSDIDFFWSKLLFICPNITLMLKLGSSILSNEGINFFKSPKKKVENQALMFFSVLKKLSDGRVFELDCFDSFCRHNLSDVALLRYSVNCLRKWRIMVLQSYYTMEGGQFEKAVQMEKKVNLLIAFILEKLAEKTGKSTFEDQLTSFDTEALLFKMLNRYDLQPSQLYMETIQGQYFQNIVLRQVNYQVKNPELFVPWLSFSLNSLKIFGHLEDKKFETVLVLVYSRIRKHLQVHKLEAEDKEIVKILVTFLVNLKFSKTDFFKSIISQVLNVSFIMALAVFNTGISRHQNDLSFLEAGEFQKMDLEILDQEIELKLWLLSTLFKNNSSVIDDVSEVSSILNQLLEMINFSLENQNKNLGIFHSLDSLALKIANSEARCLYGPILNQIQDLKDKLSSLENLQPGAKMYLLFVKIIQRKLSTKKLELSEMFQAQIEQQKDLNTLKMHLRNTAKSLGITDIGTEFIKEAEKSTFLAETSFLEKTTVVDFFFALYSLGEMIKDYSICINTLKVIFYSLKNFKLSEKNFKLVKCWIFVKFSTTTNRMRDQNHPVWSVLAWRELNTALSGKINFNKNEKCILLGLFMELIEEGDLQNFEKESKIRELAGMLNLILQKDTQGSLPFLTFVKLKILLSKFEKCPIELAKLLKEISSASNSIQNFVKESKESIQNQQKSLLLQVFTPKDGIPTEETLLYSSFLQKASISQNHSEIYNLLRESMKTAQQLSFKLRFKHTTCRILKKAIMFHKEMGEPYLMMEALKEYSYVMKIPDFEKTEKSNFKENSINHITFEILDHLRLHIDDIDADILNQNQGNISSIVLHLKEKIGSYIPLDFISQNQQLQLFGFVLSYMIDVLQLKKTRATSLLYLEEYRTTILSKVLDDTMMSYKEIIAASKAQKFVKDQSQFHKPISQAIFDLENSKFSNKIFEDIGNFVADLESSLSKLPTDLKLVTLNHIYRSLLKKYIQISSSEIDKFSILDYHISVDLVLDLLFTKYLELGHLDMMNKALDFTLDNYMKIRLLANYDLVNSSNLQPQNIKDLFNKALLCSNISHPIRALLKEDYMMLSQVINSTTKGNDKSKSKNMKRMTVRLANSIQDFYKFSYFRLKMEKGDFRFMSSLRLSDYIFSLDEENMILVYSGDSVLASSDLKSRNFVIFNRAENGSITALFDEQNALAENNQKLLDFQIEIEDQLRFHFNETTTKVDKKLFAKERKQLDIRLKKLYSSFEKELGKMVYVFSKDWADIQASKQTLDDTIEDNERLVREIIDEIDEKRSRGTHSKEKYNDVFLLLPGSLSLIPFEHLEYIQNHSKNIIRIESTLKFGSQKTTKFRQKSRYSTITLFGHASSLQIEDKNEVKNEDEKKCYYILNPEGSLKSSEKRLSKIFLGKENWEGVIGKIPKSSEIAKYLKQGYHLVYCGHGNGNKYMNVDYLNRLVNLKNQVILMGCSSAAMFKISEVHRLRDIEHLSLAGDYLTSGAKYVFGNLWSVTDRDSDKITTEMASNFIGVGTESNFNLREIKEMCTLEHLNGSAFVRYGNL